MLWWLAQNAAIAGLLAAVVAVACRVGRFRPAVRHALWLVVLIKLLTPPFLNYPAIELALAVPSPEPDPPAPTPEPALYQILAPVPQDAIITLAPAEPLPAVEQPTSSTEPLSLPSASAKEARQTLDWIAPLGTHLFLFGTTCMVFLHLAGVVRLRRLSAAGAEAPSELAAEVEHLAAMIGVRPPAVRMLPNIASPFVCGLWKSVLLWPAELSLSATRRRAVLLHELAHLRRRDHWVAWLRALAGCVWWWNPVYWIVTRQLGRNAELACDAWVIAALPEARREYAEALLAVAGRWSRTAMLAPAVGMSGSRRDFERRLVMVMRESVPCKVPVLGLVAVGVLALGVLPGLTLSQEAKKPAKIEKPAEPTQAAPAQPVQPYLIEDNVQYTQPTEFFVYTQVAPAQGEDRDRKIKELEDKLQAILKEVKALREAKATSGAAGKPKITEKPATVARPPVEAQFWRSDMVGQPTAYSVDFVYSGTADKEHTITLTRATYKLPKEKADALAAFLKHVKASVLETQVVDDGAIVTTTPEVQHTIAQLVGLLTGKPHTASWNLSPAPALAAEPGLTPNPAVKAPPAKRP